MRQHSVGGVQNSLRNRKVIIISKTSRQLFCLRPLSLTLQLPVRFYSFWRVLRGHFGCSEREGRQHATEPAPIFSDGQIWYLDGKENRSEIGGHMVTNGVRFYS